VHELQRIHEAVARVVENGTRGLLVTVVATRGSTYRKSGARSVIAEDGDVTGAISGGCVERDLALRADFQNFAPRLITYDSSSSDDIVFGLGLGCRGSITMLVEPFDAERPPVLPAVPHDAPVRHTVRFEGRVLLEETIQPQTRVAIFGRGPDVAPVELMARAVGWDVDVIRTRELPELARYDAIVVMTHNFLHDVEIIGAALRGPVAYIGLLGPKRRGEEILTQLGDVDSAALHRLHNPIGLDLGGDSPEAIALSIVAEIQSVLQRRDARPLREKRAPIHTRTIAVVLAAGASRRFGSSKQLALVDGEPLIRRAVKTALDAQCDETLVVFHDPAVAEAIADLPVRLVHNAKAAEGMASSVRAAVHAAGPARLLFTLCDQPHIASTHLRALLATTTPIAATAYNETNGLTVAGAPAVFAPQFRDELLALTGDRGARDLIDRHRDQATLLPCPEAAHDIDLKTDLARPLRVTLLPRRRL
jgi:xanthine dehydrogenase accessory factor